MATASPTRADRLGRTVATTIFAVLVGGPSLVWSIQIVRQAWTTSGQAGTVECRDGIVGLHTALERARLTAAEETTGERAAVDRFRRSLLPEWGRRHAIDHSCSDDPRALQALKDLDRLRYTEERKVRYDATNVTPLRVRMSKLRFLHPAPSSSASSLANRPPHH